MSTLSSLCKASQALLGNLHHRAGLVLETTWLPGLLILSCQHQHLCVFACRRDAEEDVERAGGHPCIKSVLQNELRNVDTYWLLMYFPEPVCQRSVCVSCELRSRSWLQGAFTGTKRANTVLLLCRMRILQIALLEGHRKLLKTPFRRPRQMKCCSVMMRGSKTE